MSLVNSTGARKDGNGTVFTPPGPPSSAPIPTGTPVVVHTPSGPEPGWINGGTVVKTGK
jgi:hypothetical protein